MEQKFVRLAQNLETMNVLNAPLEEQIDNKQIAIKRLEIEILETELHILMILRDINQDKRALDRMTERNSLEPHEIENHNYKITRAYLDVEKYQVDARHHKKRLERAKEELNDLYLSLKRQSCA